MIDQFIYLGKKNPYKLMISSGFKQIFTLMKTICLIGCLAFSSSAWSKSIPLEEIPLHHTRFSFDIQGGVTEPQQAGSLLPGGQGGFSLFYQDLDRRYSRFILLGGKLRFELLGGLPALRIRLEGDTPAFLLRALSEDSLFYYTPVSFRGIFTHHGSQTQAGVDGSVVGNTYGLVSTRFGFRGKVGSAFTFFSGKIEVGPEGGYLKDQGGHAPFAGFVTAVKGEISSPHVFARLGVEGHFNILAAFPSEQVARHGVSAQAQLGFPITSVGYPNPVFRVSAGLKAQVDYFDILLKSDSRLNEPNGLGIFGGAFIGGEIGDLR